MRRRFVLPAALLAAWLLPLAGQAARPAEHSVHGVVSKVQDGDSLWLKPADGPPIVVRLRDIDAPELCQAWGDEARRALADLALGKAAVLRSHGRDSHGRTLGAVTVDEVDLSRRMVEDGHAWSNRSRWDQGPLVKQERMAKALGRGLHATAGAEPPWQFRKRNGRCPAP
ncbi:MAG: thermonuclease family protein [Rubrivivax sp.]|nr:thermonuclease family protein [Rubrivivax sp.]